MTCAQVAGSVIKAPGEVVDFSVIWALPTGDAISTASATVESGDAVVDSSSVVSSAVVVWVSGGTCGSVSEVLITVETTGGRTLQRTVFVELRS